MGATKLDLLACDTCVRLAKAGIHVQQLEAFPPES